MIFRVRDYLFGKCVDSNTLGWRMEKLSRGFIIRPPKSGRTFIQPLAPFIVNLALLMIYYFLDNDKKTIALITCPITLIMGICGFREASLLGLEGNVFNRI
jgi:hypothetical protein